ncbi:peptidase S8 and S53 subtilisin kexin sedolisin [Haloferax sulfurifontis ATCC BAA-897]|nr:peptidase S8 and S53 subtilisin kexin sedolisin [Haloferax sulfurifontis ATCC BAA-897]
MAAPVMAASGSPFDGVFSGAATEATSYWGLGSFDDSGVTSYDGQPAFYVTFEDGSERSMETWADSQDRSLIALDNESNRALIAAAPEDIGLVGAARILGNGLAARSYVEHIDIASRVDYTEPVTTLSNASTFASPPGARFVTLGREAAFSASGQAFNEDANQSTMADARRAVRADPANVSVNGTGVTVAVIDSGLNYQDSANDSVYQDRIVSPKNTITNETGRAAVADGNGHGSWVAGAIAANPNNTTTGEPLEGVAPGANVMPIKALSDSGGGNTQDIVEGIEYADEQGADIISMSLGSAVYSATIADELSEALEGNVSLVVVAVGNSKENPALRYISSPADVPEAGVIGVAATNTTTPDNAGAAYFSEVGPDGGVSDFSNGVTNGEGPDVGAPGMKLTARVYSSSGLPTNSTLSGTSMATPVVSGVAALTLEANPSLAGDHEALRAALLDSAAPMPNAGTTEVGNGMVDAYNATRLVERDTSQEDARTDAARARDLANEGYSGSSVVRLWIELTGAAA